MTTVSVTFARRHLEQLIEQFARDHEPITITKYNKPVAVFVSMQTVKKMDALEKRALKQSKRRR
ncbi:MAG: type II toxin-antitoxin system Phd/YefM family antitoxin [Chloroflexi bacterium]|nr:type II toxin-antitoxin system Phd/YefM family antitoxin [Chloroflexota bacterium]